MGYQMWGMLSDFFIYLFILSWQNNWNSNILTECDVYVPYYLLPCLLVQMPSHNYHYIWWIIVLVVLQLDLIHTEFSSIVSYVMQAIWSTEFKPGSYKTSNHGCGLDRLINSGLQHSNVWIVEFCSSK